MSLGPSQEASNAAEQALAGCFLDAAGRLDDERSDAATIGLAVMGACNGQFEHLVDVQSSYMDPYATVALRRNLRSHELEMATQAVLVKRRHEQ